MDYCKDEHEEGRVNVYGDEYAVNLPPKANGIINYRRVRDNAKSKIRYKLKIKNDPPKEKYNPIPDPPKKVVPENKRKLGRPRIWLITRIKDDAR